MNQFGILINDGSPVLPQYVASQNVKTLELYDWQRRAIEYFFMFKHVIFEVSTGTGKTKMSIEILKKLWLKEPDIHALIIVPKNVILENTWFKELYENGVSLRDIGVYYGNIKEYGKVTITNMQNLRKIDIDRFQMCIYDEIHNYGSKKLIKYVEHPFKYKIGLTATLERGDMAHHKIEEIFQNSVFKYTPKQALIEGVLNPFKFIDISVDVDSTTFYRYTTISEELNTILKIGGGYSRIMRMDSGLKYTMLAKMQERKELVSNYYRKFDVIKHIAKRHKEDKMIVFNSYNKQTNKCYWHLLDIGVKACIVHSDIPKEKREENMIGFKRDRYQVMLTSKVLDEGYNLPSIDVGVIMAGDATSRQTIQRMGRVLRKKKKESTLYQVYCKKTIEEDYAKKRAALFKELSSDYDEFNYNGTELIN